MPSDQDSLWKELLEEYFREILALFLPEIEQKINWKRKYEFLDKELEKIAPDDVAGLLIVDKLAKVYLLNGKEKWVLLHIEVQSYVDKSFEERMFKYYSRLRERYNRTVSSIAILTDKNKKYKPSKFEEIDLGTELFFKFSVVKVIEYNKQWEQLESSNNPFAIIVMAHLKAQGLKSSNEKLTWKLRLVRKLYDRGYNQQQVRGLFKFIDWLITLPPELASEFEEKLEKYEEEKRMPYITSIERKGIERGLEQGREEGREEGRQEGIASVTRRLLKRRFGDLAPELEQKVSNLSLAHMEELNEALLDIYEVADLLAWLENKGN